MRRFRRKGVGLAGGGGGVRSLQGRAGKIRQRDEAAAAHRVLAAGPSIRYTRGRYREMRWHDAGTGSVRSQMFSRDARDRIFRPPTNPLNTTESPEKAIDIKCFGRR